MIGKLINMDQSGLTGVFGELFLILARFPGELEWQNLGTVDPTLEDAERRIREYGGLDEYRILRVLLPT